MNNFMQFGLLEFLSRELWMTKSNNVFIGLDYKPPGYWTALAAYCRAKKIKFEELDFADAKIKGYASAIALEHALNGTDGYNFERKKLSVIYSPLVLIDCADNTDKATSTINRCIRAQFDDPNLSDFVRELCDVVGDLHDNVWSHGKSTGFSMAQKWEGFSAKTSYFEFALADCGYGFLSELQRVGIPQTQDDEAAIKWCIEKGNSSKKKNQDEWLQRLPQDITNNPMPGFGQAVMSENNHQGLGLAKLIELIDCYRGQLWLASGEKTLVINNNGNRSFRKNVQKWQGVALACRFDTEQVKNYKMPNEDEVIASLLNLLGTQS